jgi:hypothetical protein
MKHDYHPRGVDGQGRHPEYAEAPAPAECASEVGNDDGPLSDSDLIQIGGILLAALLGLLVIGWLMVTR